MKEERMGGQRVVVVVVAAQAMCLWGYEAVVM